MSSSESDMYCSSFVSWETREDDFADTYADSLSLAITNPKDVFFRKHTDTKLYRHNDAYVYARGILIRSLDLRHRHPEPNTLYNSRCTFAMRCSLPCCPNKRRTYIWHDEDEKREEVEVIPQTKRERRIAHRHQQVYRSRLRLIKDDPFGFNSMHIPYSLSKKNRWALADYFKANLLDFQHPGENISTVFASSENLQAFAFAPQALFPCRSFGYEDKVNKLIACQSDGSLFIWEPKNDRGHALNYLPALPSPNIEEDTETSVRALTRKQKRTFSRQQRVEGLETLKQPVRISYFTQDPKSTFHFMNSGAMTRTNYRSRRTNYEDRHFRVPLKSIADEELLAFSSITGTNNDADEETPIEHRPTMTLGDFIPSRFRGTVMSECDGDVEIWPIELMNDVLIAASSASSSPLSNSSFVFVDENGFMYA